MILQKKEFFILLFVIIVAAFLRFSELTQFPPGLYPDEAMNGSNALEANATGHYKVFYPENNGREGLFINIQAIFLKSFLAFSPFPAPWMLHVPSVLFGIFTVLGIYFLTKELPGITNKYIPLLAAFFTATSFWHINFSRIGFRAIMAPFFLVWGIFLLLLALKKQEKNYFKNSPLTTAGVKSKIKNLLLPLIAGIVYGLGMHSYIAYRATPLLILIILLTGFFLYEKKIVFRVGSFFILGSIIATLPLIFYFIQNPQDFLGRTTQVSIFSAGSPLQNLFLNSVKTMGMFFVYGDSNWRHNLSGNPEIFFPVAMCFGLALLLGFIAFIKKYTHKRITYILLFSWFAVGAAPVVVSNEGIPHALRSILLIPPAYILAALGAEAFYKFLKRKNIRRDVILAVSFLFLTTTLFNAYYTYFVLWGENKNTRGAFAADYVKIANEINTLPRTIPKYIIVEAGGTDVRGYPMPTQTTMFLTESFLPQERESRNIHYIFPAQKNEIPPNAAVFEIK